MKTIKYLAYSALGLLTLAMPSCDNFLEEEPVDVKTDGLFWTSETDAENAVNMLYNGGVPYLYGGRNTGWQPTRLMYGGLMSGLFVDERKDGDFSANLELMNVTFQTVASDVGELYREPYVAINRANVVINRLPGMVEAGALTQERANQLLAEAYYFRAWNYFYLVKEFGCPDGQAAMVALVAL